jgi:hypothetical protein
MDRRSFLKLAGIVAAGIAIGAPNLSIDSIPVRRAMLCDINAIFAQDSVRMWRKVYRSEYERLASAPSPWLDCFPAGMGETVRAIAG